MSQIDLKKDLITKEKKSTSFLEDVLNTFKVLL